MVVRIVSPHNLIDPPSGPIGGRLARHGVDLELVQAPRELSLEPHLSKRGRPVLDVLDSLLVVLADDAGWRDNAHGYGCRAVTSSAGVRRNGFDD